MPTPSSLPLVEQAVGPRLRELLSDPDISYADVAHVLRSEYDIKRSIETLRRWATDLGYRQGDESEQAPS